jgi:hypothetical protein
MSKKIILNKINNSLIEATNDTKPKVVTEELGKIFEMAICLLYDTPYVGKFKYSMCQAETIRDKIKGMKSAFPQNITHTAEKGARYDFTCKDTEGLYLSAKSTKKGDKVCPQVIGQPSKKKFCQHFGIDNSITIPEIKKYIQTNIQSMLQKYFEYTYDCPIIYYNQHKNLFLFVKKIKDIVWTDYTIDFSHIKKEKEWNESTTISIQDVSIGEFQVHNHRDNIKFRWCFENILDKFKDHFEIIKITSE